MRTIAMLAAAITVSVSGQTVPAPIVDNERVAVWSVSAGDARPSPAGGAIEIALTPSPGAVALVTPGKPIDRAGRPAPARAVIVALKDHPVPPLANTSGYPNAFPRPHVKRVLENDRVIVWDYSWTRGEPTPMHFHDKDVVVTYLGDGPLRSTTPDGQSTVNAYKAGMVRFNLRDRTHTELLERGTQRAIIVELK